MKILVINNAEATKNSKNTFAKIEEFLRRQGHNVKSDIEFKKPASNDSLEALEKIQVKVNKAIRDTDIVVTDLTEPDAKLGYDISKAISEKKIVIGFKDEANIKNKFTPIEAHSEKLLIVKSFNSDNLEDVVKQAVEEAKGKMDTKFILIISPEIDRYLDWASQTKRMHKAQIVRNAVENVISKDKDYKNYLQG